MLRLPAFRTLIVVLAGWLALSTAAVLVVTLVGGGPNSRAVILMGTGLVVLWVGVCGSLMFRLRDRLRSLAPLLGVPVDAAVRPGGGTIPWPWSCRWCSPYPLQP